MLNMREISLLNIESLFPLFILKIVLLSEIQLSITLGTDVTSRSLVLSLNER